MIHLVDNPVKTPPYPSFEYKRAFGGEANYCLKEEKGLFVSEKYIAEPGEILREPDLRFRSDISQNLKYRIKVAASCKGNPHAQKMQKEFCRSDLLYFINTWVYTFDPRLKGRRTVPFITYPMQDSTLEWTVGLIKSDSVGLVEKSRDMGASWMFVGLAVWLALFHTDMVPLFMSMRENDVDDRSPGSLLGKVRIVLRNLPEWMRGGWTEKGSCDNVMTITIPDTQSIIKGILSKGTAGRSDRASIVFADEFAFVEQSRLVLDALSELSNCKLFLSTANGMGNEFGRMAHDPSVNKISLHWQRSPHPMKNVEWAKKKKAGPDMTDETWAKEQDINYHGSTSGRVYPEFISVEDSLIPWCHVKRNDPVYGYDPAYKVYTGMDFGMGDPTSILWAQIKPAPPEFHMFTQEMIVFFDELEDTSVGVWEARYILNHRGYQYADHVGDMRTGSQRDSTGNTWISNFKAVKERPVWSQYFKENIHLGHPVIVNGKFNSEFAPIQTMRTLLKTPGAVAINGDKCPGMVMAMENWSYPTQLNPVTGKMIAVPDSKPKHDQFSHSMKAAVYLIDWLRNGPTVGSVDQGEWDVPHIRISRL